MMTSTTDTTTTATTATTVTTTTDCTSTDTFSTAVTDTASLNNPISTRDTNLPAADRTSIDAAEQRQGAVNSVRDGLEKHKSNIPIARNTRTAGPADEPIDITLKRKPKVTLLKPATETSVAGKTPNP